MAHCTSNHQNPPISTSLFSLPVNFDPQEKNKRKRGQRGFQKHPPSGHLAPTIQIRKGVFYPRINGINEQERRFALRHHPELNPHWFIWLYQWSEKHPVTGLWHTRSKVIPFSQIWTIKKAIASRKTIAQILKLIET